MTEQMEHVESPIETPAPETPPPASNPPASGTGATASNQAAPGKDWQKSYAGLQSTYQKLLDRFNKLEASHSDQTAELESTRQQLVAAQSELNTLRGETATSKAQLARQKMIMQDFPDLADFEANGLLPTDGDETALRGKLTSFRDNLKARGVKLVERQMAGASPTGSSTTTGGTPPAESEDEDYLWAQISRWAGRDDAKAAEYKDRWDALQERKAQQT